MDWGFYCRTCGESSLRFYKHPSGPRNDALSVGEKVLRLAAGDDVTLPTVKIPVLLFLSRHAGHDLWAECPVGVLQLTRGASPRHSVEPPRFAIRDSLRAAGR